MNIARSLRRHADLAPHILRFMPLAIALSAGWIAFGMSARAHALDLLMARSLCGNPAMPEATTLILGHCPTCWLTGAGAAAAAFVTADVLRRLALAHGCLKRPRPRGSAARAHPDESGRRLRR